MESEQKKTAETFDAYQGRYSDAVNDSVSFTGLDVDFFTRVKAAYIDDLVTGHFGAGKDLSALDVGCGVGNFHKLLAPTFGHLHGVDVSKASIEKARSLHDHVAYKTYDGGPLPYESNSFDVAFTICVLHHVPVDNWEEFVREMYRVVRPGGLALIFEHNPVNPLTMRAVNNCPFDADAVLLKKPKTVQLFKQAGFDPVKARFIISIPPANGILRKIDRLFSRIPFGAQYYVAGTKR